MVWPPVRETWATWPGQETTISLGTQIKLKADAFDTDGLVTQVQFWVETSFETNLVGMAVAPPFTALWQFGDGATPDVRRGYWSVKAVATDNEGGSTESGRVKVYYLTGVPPMPVVELVSPKNLEVFAEPATFEFVVEQFASLGDTGPIDFFLGTNRIGSVDDGTSFSADTPPRSIVVSNLLAGEYKLTVRYAGQNGDYCISCQLSTNIVRVVKLGIRSPSLTVDRRLEFAVVSSYPGRPTIIEASSNLVDWHGVSTNIPSSNVFNFAEPVVAGPGQRFHRVWLPPE
jgi:hypothetical protein